MNLLKVILLCFTYATLQAELFFTPEMTAKHLETYTDEEIRLIKKDLNVVRSICLEDTKNTENKFYLATAGAPGAFKSTILEKFVASHPEYQDGVYLDPDPRSLKFMVHTYYAQSLTPLKTSLEADYSEVIKNAYNKWRHGSTYIALTLFEEAVALGRSIIYGTTSTGSHVSDFFPRLKEDGYRVILLLCSCSDELRKESIEYRNSKIRFYQSSPEDALAKGKFFPEKMHAYFEHGDILYFYWSDSLFSSERLAGIWEKGKLEVLDQDAMEQFINKYELDRQALRREGKILPPFEDYLTNF